MEEIFSEKEHSIAHAAHEILARDIRSCLMVFPNGYGLMVNGKPTFIRKFDLILIAKEAFLDKDDNSHTGTRILIRLPNWLGDGYGTANY